MASVGAFCIARQTAANVKASPGAVKSVSAKAASTEKPLFCSRVRSTRSVNRRSLWYSSLRLQVPSAFLENSDR